MRHPTKIITLTLLIAFFGLLTLGTVADQSVGASKHNRGVDCFGTGCGPTQHVALHDYLVVSRDSGGEHIESHNKDFTDSENDYTSPEISQESPPPKFS